MTKSQVSRLIVTSTLTVPAHKHDKDTAFQEVKKNKEAKMTHKYDCTGTIAGPSIPPCFPLGGSKTVSAGQRSSVGIADIGTGQGGSKTKNIPCPCS